VRRRTGWLIGVRTWPPVARLAALAIAAGAIASCKAAVPAASPADRALASRLTGVWNATFSSNSSSLALSGADSIASHVQGAVTFLETSRRELVDGLPRGITHVGLYDIDLSPLRLALAKSGPGASLVATSIAPDSIIARVPAGARSTTLLLRGVLAGDSIRGRWIYSGRSVGSVGGTFVLHRRRP